VNPVQIRRESQLFFLRKIGGTSMIAKARFGPMLPRNIPYSKTTLALAVVVVFVRLIVMSSGVKIKMPKSLWRAAFRSPSNVDVDNVKSAEFHHGVRVACPP
jgi:hypothetical protein